MIQVIRPSGRVGYSPGIDVFFAGIKLTGWDAVPTLSGWQVEHMVKLVNSFPSKFVWLLVRSSFEFLISWIVNRNLFDSPFKWHL